MLKPEAFLTVQPSDTAWSSINAYTSTIVLASHWMRSSLSKLIRHSLKLSLCILRATRRLHCRWILCHAESGTGGAVSLGWNVLRQPCRLFLTSSLYYSYTARCPINILHVVCFGVTLALEAFLAFVLESTFAWRYQLAFFDHHYLYIVVCFGVALALEAYLAFVLESTCAWRYQWAFFDRSGACTACILRTTRRPHCRWVWCHFALGTGGAVSLEWNGLRQPCRLFLTCPLYHSYTARCQSLFIHRRALWRLTGTGSVLSFRT
jgi:hypothetical protein